MTDRLDRLFGPANIASGTSTIFTGTAAHTATIKTLGIVNSTTADITVSLYIHATTATTSAASCILPTTTIEAGGMAMCDSPHMIEGTESLNAVASASGLTITGHGLDSS